MRIYFTASIVGKKQYLQNYISVIDYIKRSGHEIHADHIINTTEQDIRLETKQDRLHFHQELKKQISDADCMVVEASFPSISVGYEISLAIRLGKPVLILYAEGDPPSLFNEFDEDKIICEKYNNQNINGIVDDFLNFVKGKSEMRFTFFITPRIATFLDEKAEEKKLPKSVYLRQLIEKEMSS